jgi:hypothetical protein
MVALAINGSEFFSNLMFVFFTFWAISGLFVVFSPKVRKNLYLIGRVASPWASRLYDNLLFLALVFFGFYWSAIMVIVSMFCEYLIFDDEKINT